MAMKMYIVEGAPGWTFVRKPMPFMAYKAFVGGLTDLVEGGSATDYDVAEYIFPNFVDSVTRPDGSVVTDILTEEDWLEVGQPMVQACLAVIIPKALSGAITPTTKAGADGESPAPTQS